MRNRHAVPNALLPTTTLDRPQHRLRRLGAITVETVFSIPASACCPTRRSEVPDFWVLQGIFLVASAGVIVANLVADLVYGCLDPRVRT